MPLLIAKSHFEHTTTIETLVEELMIEEWTNITSFHSYYAYCNPNQCTYSYSERMNVAFVVIFIIGAFGGLSFVLDFSIPFLVKLGFRIYRWSKRPRPASNNNKSMRRPWRKLLFILSANLINRRRDM